LVVEYSVVRHNSGMIEKISSWFNKTGYPLEILSAGKLIKNQYRVINSYLYDDPEKNISRELDLYANKSWYDKNDDVSFELSLLVECKKSEKPFVLISSRQNDKNTFSFGEFYDAFSQYSRLLMNSQKKHINLPGNSSRGFKLVQAFTNSDETIYKATNSLLKSFNDWIKNEEGHLEESVKMNLQTIALPILIIDSPLYEATLNTSGDIDFKEINCGVLEYGSKLFNMYPEPFPILIIPIAEFDHLLSSLVEFGNETFEFLMKNPLYQIKNYHNTEFKLVDRNALLLKIKE